MLATADIFLFDEFRLDRQGEGLSRRDARGVFIPLPVGPRTLDVLSVLVERAGQLVTKEEIMATVWRRSVVDNANLTVQISTLRRVLDQGRAEGSCIQTVAARGYRIVAPVTRVGRGEEERGTAALYETQDDDPNSIAIHAEERPSQTVGRLPLSRSRRRQLALVGFATIAALMLVGAAVSWTRLASPPAPMTENRPGQWSLSAPRLSIVVLPFADRSEDRGQQYFADGITDDLTTDLSRLQNVLVISRNTAFTYKDKPIDAKQIGRELGVRYVLEGSVRRSGNQIRVNSQLIDAATNTHLWAERFDHDVGNLLGIQNEITSRIANTLGWELVGAETTRPAERPDALDYILQGRAAFARSPAHLEEAITLFERALALDPSSVEAQSRLANYLRASAMNRNAEAAGADLQRAEQLIAQALATSPGDPYAHFVKGSLLESERRCEEAIPEFEITLAANRNYPSALVELSRCKYLTGGSDEEAIALTEQAIKLSPRDPNLWWWYTWIGFVHLLQSRIDEAIAWLEKGRSAQPKAPPPHFFLAAAYGYKGERERARSELAEAQKLLGSDRYGTIARSRANGDLYTPALRDRWETVYFPGMRAAGAPEE